MTPWRRLVLVALIVTALLIVGGLVTDARTLLALGFLFNILASPFALPLTDWVVHGSTAPIVHAAPLSTQSVPTDRSGSDAVTGLLVAAVNIYALLFVNFVSSVLLFGFDQLETVHLLSFKDDGYIEAQKFIAGALLIAIWLPAMTTLNLVLGRSVRSLSPWPFLGGAALSLPVYFVAAHALGVETGFGDPNQPSLALGAQLPDTPGYVGYRITALLIRNAMLLVVGLTTGFYAWAIAWVSRAATSVVRWVRTRVSRG